MGPDNNDIPQKKKGGGWRELLYFFHTFVVLLYDFYSACDSTVLGFDVYAKFIGVWCDAPGQIGWVFSTHKTEKVKNTLPENVTVIIFILFYNIS